MAGQRSPAFRAPGTSFMGSFPMDWAEGQNGFGVIEAVTFIEFTEQKVELRQ